MKSCLLLVVVCSFILGGYAQKHTTEKVQILIVISHLLKSGMIGLQEMLMQTVGETIHILASWSRDKEVCFKLHAPHSTTIEVEYIDDVLQKLDVQPK